MKPISSRDNPLIKHLRALLDDARYRRSEAATLLDGPHLLAAASAAGVRIERVLVTQRASERDETLRLLETALPEACPVFLIPDALMRHISPVETPAGLLTEIRIPEYSDALDATGDVLLLEGVQDAGNLGTLLRTAAAAGVRQVCLSSGCVHAWAPKVLRAAMGAHFALHIREGADLPALATAWPGPVLATSLAEGAQDLFALNLHAPSMWLFGSEGQGLSPQLASHATHLVRIPMAAQTESLNVAAAAAICLFEQMRQRRSA